MKNLRTKALYAAAVILAVIGVVGVLQAAVAFIAAAVQLISPTLALIVAVVCLAKARKTSFRATLAALTASVRGFFAELAA